jgi:hypothetical protein
MFHNLVSWSAKYDFYLKEIHKNTKFNYVSEWLVGHREQELESISILKCTKVIAVPASFYACVWDEYCNIVTL